MATDKNKVRCFHCRHVNKVPGALESKDITCKKCGETFWASVKFHAGKKPGQREPKRQSAK